MQIEFCINNIDSFLHEIAGQFGIRPENNSFNIPAKYGQGFLTQKKLSNDILITYYELILNESATVVRKSSENDNIIPIIFWISNSGITQQLNTESRNLGMDTPNGIFLPSNRMGTTYECPANVLFKNITLYIKKDWLKKNLNLKEDYISNTILKKTNYFLFEEISFEMAKVLEAIELEIKTDSNATLSKLFLLAKALTISHLFFDKILSRPLNKGIVNIRQDDVERIFMIKSFLTDNYVIIPTAKELSIKSGMNERKMQRIFKQIFGKSIYQFAISIRMNEAKTMLSSKEYSVSEVGYSVGYTNLSHFTEQFKKSFGTTPKSFLSSV